MGQRSAVGLSPEQNEALRARGRKLVPEFRSQNAVARQLGIAGPSLSQFLTGKTGASLKLAEDIERLEAVAFARKNALGERDAASIEAAVERVLAYEARPARPLLAREWLDVIRYEAERVRAAAEPLAPADELARQRDVLEGAVGLDVGASRPSQTNTQAKRPERDQAPPS